MTAVHMSDWKPVKKTAKRREAAPSESEWLSGFENPIETRPYEAGETRPYEAGWLPGPDGAFVPICTINVPRCQAPALLAGYYPRSRRGSG
jgi:hypothetical protein